MSLKNFGKKDRIVLFLSVVIILLDQWTKQLTLDRFVLGESIAIIEGFFNFTYVQNKGAAFGFLAGAPDWFRIPFFFTIPFIALGFIYNIYRKLPRENVKVATAIGLILGGAIGNILDRIQHGFVVDFIDFHWKEIYHYPAFNIADSAICIGIALFVLDIFYFHEMEISEKEFLILKNKKNKKKES